MAKPGLATMRVTFTGASGRLFADGELRATLAARAQVGMRSVGWGRSIPVIALEKAFYDLLAPKRSRRSAWPTSAFDRSGR